tara:strand:+ start:106327 stop:107454 length:1128 start_codon:yes stop_codon:yes gene_type:complete
MSKIKNPNRKHQKSLRIAVIGSGAVGSITALHLSNQGHQITLIDPDLKNKINNSMPINGSKASLGVLMGNISRRRSGRNWELKKRSLEIWPSLIEQIKGKNESFKINKPLIKLASSEDELNKMKELVIEKKYLGLEIMNSELINYFSKILNKNYLGGLISYMDGRIDSLNLLKCLSEQLDKNKIEKIAQKVIKLDYKYKKGNKLWLLELSDNETIEKDIIVICCALGSCKLVNNLGHQLLLEPVLGQVIQLNINGVNKDWSKWPAILTTEGINFILENENSMLIGATLEPGEIANEEKKYNMLNMNGEAPIWMNKNSIKSEWNGLRARPIGRSAPILESLEPGLILNTGHYRNGILLAPACAEWVEKEIYKTYIN